MSGDDLPTRHVLRKFWWAAGGDLKVADVMFEAALRWHQRMNNHTTYNNGFNFPECFRSLAYATAHQGRKGRDPQPRRPKVPVIWYRWGSCSPRNLEEALVHNNGQTVLGWHFNLLEKAMRYLELDRVDKEPFLEDGDYRKIVLVHDLSNLDISFLRHFRTTWRFWANLHDLKFITDRFYPWCLHREDLFLGTKKQHEHFKHSRPENNWRFVVGTEELLDVLPALNTANDYPVEYLPDNIPPGRCSLKAAASLCSSLGMSSRGFLTDCLPSDLVYTSDHVS
ncbi:hypothetical protein QBC44DRAFT_355860 [Cladorrhinum sp. PSN332]|nr:hypothetical protein QBC44DRAFT_355860 [Cladorrhinum sp. PSN332]